MLSDKSSGIGIKKSEGNHPLTKSQTKIRATALHYGIANIRIILLLQVNFLFLCSITVNKTKTIFTPISFKINTI